jgi:hypothetical protein
MIRGKRGLDLRRSLQKLSFEMHDLQYRMGKPTIAAMVGPARAAGVTLAVSCDGIVAGESTSRPTGLGRAGGRALKCAYPAQLYPFTGNRSGSL